MTALALGLIAAFAWGLHDIIVRYISQNAPIVGCLFIVLVVGGIFQTGIVFSINGYQAPTGTALLCAILAGGVFGLASLCLYAAFKRGPVRLVAPIIASYPVLSVTWAVGMGVSVSIWQVLAVSAVIAGVSLVAVLSDDSDAQIPAKGPTIAMAALASVGFAATFALGQYAAHHADELSTILITRYVAILGLLCIAILYAQRLWPGRKAFAFLVFMGLLDGLALLCVLYAGGLPDAQYAAVASSVFGMITVVLAWAFLHEKMRPLQWVGCAITFCAIGYLAL